MEGSNENLDENVSKDEEDMSENEDDDLMNDCQASLDEAPDKKRFEVKKLTAHALWSWDVAVEICAICRNQVLELCIECQANPDAVTDAYDCIVTWGKCKHAFHLHCISRWLKTHSVCPLDNRDWEGGDIQ